MDEELLDELELEDEELDGEEFQVPSFLEESSEEEVHERMLKELPEDIDKSEGGYVYDLTRPTASEVARLKEFELVEALKLIWPRFAEGIYLDYHAETRGLERKEAINAAGILNIKGTLGTVIPEGTIFTTESINDEPEKEYETLEEAVIQSEEGVNVPIQSIEAGLAGNSAANTIILEDEMIEGISEVTNMEPVSGGMEAEEDESLRERIMEYDQSQGSSFVGNIADYKRWASSVEGVGSVTVQEGHEGDGIVKIILTDANGEPASTELCKEVEKFIMSPDQPENRLAPVNAKVQVSAPTKLEIAVSANVKLRNAVLDDVKKEFLESLKKYLKMTGEDGEIRYTQVANLLGDTLGVYDFEGLKLSYDSTETTMNIPVSKDKIPSIGESGVSLTLIEMKEGENGGEN